MILKVVPSATAARAKSVRPDSYENCDAGYFCALNTPWQGMSEWDEIPNEILHHGTYFFPWGECSPATEPGCDEGIHAYANNTRQGVWLEQDQDSGNEACITNHTYNLDYQGANGLDYWIYLSSNPDAC